MNTKRFVEDFIFLLIENLLQQVFSLIFFFFSSCIKLSLNFVQKTILAIGKTFGDLRTLFGFPGDYYKGTIIIYWIEVCTIVCKSQNVFSTLCEA